MLALFAEGNPMPATNDYLQYGSFGVLCLIIAFWMFKGIPGLLNYHKETVVKITEDMKESNRLTCQAHQNTISELVKGFSMETEQCRNERIEAQKFFKDEMEKNRSAKTELAQMFQKNIETIIMKKSA